MDTKFQRKHESDMTRKEKRELEREKLASIHGWDKVEYILSYYKFHIAAVILLIALSIGIVHWVGSLKDENYIYVTAVNASMQESDIMEDFRKSIGDEEEHHKYLLDTSVFLRQNEDGEGANLDYNSTMKLSTEVGAGVVDVMICPKSVYDQYGGEDNEVLYQISDLMGETFVEEHQDICTSDAILVKDNAVLKKYGLLEDDEDMYLIVFGYGKHPEVAKEFVEFVTK